MSFLRRLNFGAMGGDGTRRSVPAWIDPRESELEIQPGSLASTRPGGWSERSSAPLGTTHGAPRRPPSAGSAAAPGPLRARTAAGPSVAGSSPSSVPPSPRRRGGRRRGAPPPWRRPGPRGRCSGPGHGPRTAAGRRGPRAPSTRRRSALFAVRACVTLEARSLSRLVHELARHAVGAVGDTVVRARRASRA